MTTRPLVDPELAAMLDQVPTVKLTEAIVKQVRAMGQTQTLLNLPTFPDIEVTERFVPGPRGAPEVRVLLYLPIRWESIRLASRLRAVAQEGGWPLLLGCSLVIGGRFPWRSNS